MEHSAKETKPYTARTKRIALEVPIELREELATFVPSGLLSVTIRLLLTELIKLRREEGSYKVSMAILNERLTISLVEEESMDED